jgi:hypothetical protein
MLKRFKNKTTGEEINLNWCNGTWEEVPNEPDFKVLSLLFNDMIYKITTDYRYPKPEAKYRNSTDNGFVTLSDVSNENPSDLSPVIYSIERKDGVIFTLSDTIDCKPYYRGKIAKFILRNNNTELLVKIENISCEFLINGVDKVLEKPVIFTTEDGVGIKEGDKVCALYKDSYKPYCSFTMVPFFGNRSLDNYRYFSTKEKAEEYMLYNTPILSIQDIIYNIKSKTGFTSFDTVDHNILKGLIQKVKNKLNL